MKFLHIILTTAMVIQLSMAASIGRVKRDENLVNALKDVVEIFKTALPITEIVTKDVLTKIPDTLAYSKYREELEEYLKSFVEYKSKSGPCVDKTFDMITNFDQLIESYEAEDAPAEAQNIAKLIDEDPRFDDVEKELEVWGAKYKIADIDETVSNVSYKDALAILPLVSQVC